MSVAESFLVFAVVNDKERVTMSADAGVVEVVEMLTGRAGSGENRSPTGGRPASAEREVDMGGVRMAAASAGMYSLWS